MRAQGRRTETTSTVDGAIDVAALAVLSDSNTNRGTDRKSICVHANKVELYPVISVTRVLKKHGPKPVGREGATDHLQNVLVAVIINVCKRHSMTLLQMTESARSCYI